MEEIKTKKVSDLSEISTIKPNTYILISVPGVTNYKMSIENLKKAFTEGVATSDELAQYINKIPSIEGLATEEYVDMKISGIVIPEIPEFPSLEGLATEEYVDTKISGIVIPEIPEFPSLEGLASEEYVDMKISGIVIPEIPEFPSLDPFVTKDVAEDLDRKLNNITDEIIKNEKVIANTINEINENINSNDNELQRQINNLTDEVIKNEKVIANTFSNHETQIQELTNQLNTVTDLLSDINSSNDEDDNLNTLADIKKFLEGFNEGITLSGVLFKLKQDILNS